MSPIGLDISVYEYTKLVEEEHEREPKGEPACYEGCEYGGRGHVTDRRGLRAIAARARGRALLSDLEQVHELPGRQLLGLQRLARRTLQGRARRRANPDEWREAPFFELINFSDCEGTIGPVAAAELARDFQEQREKVRPQLEALGADGWFASQYDRWAVAFDMAAGRGLVEFH